LKKVFLKDLKERGQVDSGFLVTRKDSGISKAGKPYLNLKLMDSSGEVEARVWDNAEELSEKFMKDDVVNVRGYVVAYQGGLQINVADIDKVKEGEYSIRDFLPSSGRDPAEMMKELEGIVGGVSDKHLKALINAFIKDPGVRERFMLAPAAKTMHHPYLGGLLEHVLSLCGLVERIRGHYGGIDWDLLIAGAVLHDMGKIHELSYERSFGYTDEGRLLGHITIEMEMIGEKIKGLVGFPANLALRLKHMILSHHGQLEFGSPKRPKTPEALILSFLDDLDAKVTAMQALIAGGAGVDENWTPFNRFFERFIYKGGDGTATPSGTDAPAGPEGAEGAEGAKVTSKKREKDEEPGLF
jgi:3'-5' exoribonuclease